MMSNHDQTRPNDADIGHQVLKLKIEKKAASYVKWCTISPHHLRSSVSSASFMDQDNLLDNNLLELAYGFICIIYGSR